MKARNNRISSLLLALATILLLGNCTSRNVAGSKQNAGFTDMFANNSMENWEGDMRYWRMEEGVLIGEISPQLALAENTFLIWKGEVADFEWVADFKISAHGNSGINYRNERVEGLQYALKGYQADIDGQNAYTGQNYEERRRTTIAYRGEKVILPTSDEGKVEHNAWTLRVANGTLGTSDSLKNLIHANDWNELRLVVKGNRLQHYVNGVLMSDVTDNDEVNRSFKGQLGIQLHVGPPMQVAFKNVKMKKL